MWSDGRDTNEVGEPILLLQPIISKQKHTKSNQSPSSSHIGGVPCFYRDDSSPIEHSSILCSECEGPMHLLLQLNSPLDDLDRSLYVFGCNRPSCHVSKFDNAMEDCKFKIQFESSPIRCFRSQQSTLTPSTTELPSKQAQVDYKLEDNDWGDSNWSASGSDDDDWGIGNKCKNDTTNEVSMDDLEAMISKCDIKSKTSTSGTQPKTNDKMQSENIKTSINVLHDTAPFFQRYNLDMFDEPPSSRIENSDDDDEDDGIGSNKIDSSKVSQMLSKYLEMEEDQEILSALQGGRIINSDNNPGKSSGSGGGERYESLPPEEKAFLQFSKRLKRAPLQVVRYAYGGVPLWSIPHQQTNTPKSNQRYSKSNKKQGAASSYQVPTVPACICGSQRVFEFQLLPSMLHILDVDSSAGELNDLMDISRIGGMNWGSIAVYSCPNSCNQSREEVCIVQNGDEVEVKKKEVNCEGDGNDDHSMQESEIMS